MEAEEIMHLECLKLSVERRIKLLDDNYVEFKLNGSFLKNAGIMGLLRMLECNESEAIIGTDYIIEDRTIKVSKDYILKKNLGYLYVKSLVQYYGQNTKFMNLYNKKGMVDSYMLKDEITDDEMKIIADSINEMGDMLLKNSFVSGYEIIDKYTDATTLNVNRIKEMKKEKDVSEKYKIYCEIYELLEQKEVQDILIIKDLMYTKLNMFYDSISFFQPSNLKSDIVECYNKEFVIPLRDEIENTKEGKKRCIECRRTTNSVKAISFINQTDDVNRKKSHYWNQKADALACPYCSFLYSLVPLGFCFTGANAVFININTDVERMKEMMNKYLLKDDGERVSEKSKIYRVFTSEAADMVEKGVANIQVVVKMKEHGDYDIKVISKDIVEGFRIAQTNAIGKNQNRDTDKKGILTMLEKINVKTDNGYINVYDMAMECILNRRSLYYIFDSMYMLALKNGSRVNYLKNVLDLQYIFRGGKNRMSDLKEMSDKAYNCGIYARTRLTDTKIADKDNALRGVVYRLENSLTIGDVDQYLDAIIRIYSSKGMPIPGIFKEMMESEENFNAIGRGYILGLMYEKYDPSEKNEERKQEEKIYE